MIQNVLNLKQIHTFAFENKFQIKSCIMKKVTGIGGIFLKCRDLENTRAWYARHLGIQMEPWGANLRWSDDGHPDPYSVLGFFKRNTDYFAPSDQPFMINFRVENLDALVAELRAADIELVVDPIEEEFGKFAWTIDPEGNKIELWEQPV
jgi:predicted enzyme related to lactoylglutathione lyase